MDPLLADIDPSVAEGDEEHSGGYYRCRDDISNFRIKVRVRKVVPTSASSVTLRNVSTSGKRPYFNYLCSINGEKFT